MAISCNFISKSILERLSKSSGLPEAIVREKIDLYSTAFRSFTERDIPTDIEFHNFIKQVNMFGESETMKRLKEEHAKDVTLTAEQTAAVDTTLDFIKKRINGESTGDKNYAVIQGKAGTGKTTIVRSIINDLKRNGIYPSVAVSALSRKAVRVLSEKLEGLGVATETLYTLCGAETGSSDVQFKINEKKEKFGNYDLVFVDEASMVSDKILSDIDRYMKMYPKLTVIFLGDDGQLRPISASQNVTRSISFGAENQVVEKFGKSPIFSRQDMLVSRLTERLRQGEDSPILPFADLYWNISTGKDKSDTADVKSKMNSVITSKGALVFNQRGVSTDTLIFEAMQRGLESGRHDYAKVITAKNAAVYEWNNKIHNRLFPFSPNAMCVGDQVMFNVPYNSKKAKIENAEEGTITKISKNSVVEKYDGMEITSSVYTIKLADGRTADVRVIDDIEQKNTYDKICEKLKNEALRRRDNGDSSGWKPYYDFKDSHIHTFFIEGEGGAPLQMGYAITAHKAQGSTYDISIVDEKATLSFPTSNQGLSESLYTSVTRARNVVMMITAKPADVSGYSLVELSANIDNGKNTDVKKVEKPIDNPEVLDTAVQITENEEDSKKETSEDTASKGVEITYTPTGKTTQTYTVVGSHIYNKEGKEVFASDSVDRNKIFANLAVKQGRAVVIEYRDTKYIVNDNNAIISGKTGKIMQWGEENGDRKAIIEIADKKRNTEKVNVETEEKVQTQETSEPEVSEVKDEVKDTASAEDTSLPGEKFTLHSGEAEGADSEWAFKSAAYGIKYEQHTSTNLTQEMKDEADVYVNEANKVLERNFPTASGEETDNKIRRDWFQVKDSDMVVAIAKKFTTTQTYTSPDGQVYGGRQVVDGGTGWAVQMAINKGIPVFVFNQVDNMWYEYVNGTWKESSAPTLTNNFTGVGTRDISDSGKKAIDEVLRKNFGAPFGVDESYSPKKVLDKSSLGNENSHIVRFTSDFNTLQRQEISNSLSWEFTRQLNRLKADQTSNLQRLLDEERRRFIETSDKTAERKIEILEKQIAAFNDPETGRVAVLNFYGVQNFLNKYIKQHYKEDLQSSIEELMEDMDVSREVAEKLKRATLAILDLNEDESPRYTEKEAAEHQTTFDLYVKSILKDIESREGISLDMVERKNTTNSKTSVEGEQEEEDNKDDTEGTTVNGTEGWSYKARFTDPFTSASKKTKGVLAHIVKVDRDNNLLYDSFMQTQHYDSQYIHAVLINELSSMISPDDFYNKETGKFPALEKLAYVVDDNGEIVKDENDRPVRGKYPWVEQVIKLLNTDDRISTFYTDFRKDFISYWMQKGKSDMPTKSFPMNKPNSLSGARSQALQYYESNQKVNSDAIYDFGNILPDKVEIGKNLVKETKTLLARARNEGMTDDILDKVVKNMVHMAGMLGFRTSEKAVLALYNNKNGDRMTEGVLSQFQVVFSNALDIDDNHLVTEFDEAYNEIADKLGLVEELDNVQTVRQGDKMFYSYSAPNYFDTMVKQLKQDGRARQAYIENRFKKYRWFFNNGTWNSEWLRLLESDNNVAKTFDTMQLTVIDNRYYREWTPNMITNAFIVQYFAPDVKEDRQRYAYYSSPIFSDSPVAKFIKMVKFTGETPDSMKNKLVPLIRNVVRQEMHRIKLVNERRNTTVGEIANFDKNGDKFFFLPELNTFEFAPKEGEEKGKTFIELTKEAIEKKDNNWLNSIIDTAVRTVMDNNFNEYYERFEGDDNIPIRKTLREKLGRGVATDDESFRNAIEEYFWNQFYANTQIIQLTTTDLAFYKDLNRDGGVDFQKRFKEVYAAGTRLNTNSKLGRKFEKTIYLKDVRRASTGYTAIRNAINKAVADRQMSQFAADEILSKFKDITTTDAQAYRSMDSFKSVLDMMGLWNDKMDKTLENIKKQEWNMDDFYTIWNTIKPFVFTNISKPTGISDTEKFGEEMLVPHQNKNSEFLLMATAGMFAYSMSMSPTIKGLNRFMEKNGIDVAQFESSVKVGGQGLIDISYSRRKMQKFKETSEWAEVEKMNVKGSDFDKFRAYYDELLEKGTIDQETYNNKIEDMSEPEVTYTVENGVRIEHNEVEEYLEEITKNYTMTPNPDYDENDSSSPKYIRANENIELREGFNPEIVHFIPYEDYMIAQPTPPHLVDTKAVFGSQFRNIIEADLPNYKDFRVSVNGKNYTKSEVKKLYKSLIVENLLDDFENLQSRFGSIEKLQKAILSVVEGNPKYGREVIDALQIVEKTDPETGIARKQFAIPINNPATTRKIQEVVNSMFKNSIQKQKINGGACILVSNFGYSKDLHLLHDEETGRIIGAECYLPAWSKVFFQKYVNPETGIMDVDSIPENLKKMIAYRIPTEHKYSMLPLVVKGFLPSQNGSVIMLPMETITNSGEDFDVDKKFLMMPQFTTENLRVRELLTDFRKSKDGKSLSEESIKEAMESIESGTTNGTEAELKLLGFIAEANGKYGSLTPVKIEYNPDIEPSKQGEDIVKRAEQRLSYLKNKLENELKRKEKNDEKIASLEKKVSNAEHRLERSKKNAKEYARAARNNMILDIAYAILTHADMASQVHHPGNFDNIKRASRVAKILSSWEILNDLKEQMGSNDEVVKYILDPKNTTEVLEDLLQKYKKIHNPCNPGTFEYFHKQNMTGDALIGMYANNTAAQAKYQNSELMIRDEYSFRINGKTIHDATRMTVEKTRGTDNNLVSFNCAEFGAASVDNAKDPVLADLMQTTKTANITATMLRIGMSIQEIGLVFSMPSVRYLIEDLEMLSEKSLDGFIKSINETASKIGISLNFDKLVNEEVTSEDMVEAAITHGYTFAETAAKVLESNPGAKENIKKALEKNLKVLNMISKIVKISKDISTITRISRADSPNGALKPSIAQGKAQKRAVELFNRQAERGLLTVYGTQNVLKNDVMMDENGVIRTDKDYLRNEFNSMPLSSLQAFYTLGIDLSTELMKPYFPQTRRMIDSLVDEVLDMTNYGNLSTTRWDQDTVTMDDLYDEITTFALADTKFFGNDGEDTYEKKRDYYIYRYPEIFMDIVRDNPDIANLQIIKKLQVKNGKICLINSGRLSTLMREGLMGDFDSLLYMDTPDHPGVAQQLIEDLIRYSYYTEQLKFGANSFGNYFSPLVMSKLTEVMNAMENVEKTMSSETARTRFKDQFMLQHGKHVSYKITDQGEYKNGVVYFPASLVLNPNTKNGGIMREYVYSVKKNSDNAYTGLLKFSGMLENKAMYIPVQNIGIKDYVRYNPKMTAAELGKIKFSELRWGLLKQLQNRIVKKRGIKIDIEQDLAGFDPNFELPDSPMFSKESAPSIDTPSAPESKNDDDYGVDIANQFGEDEMPRGFENVDFGALDSFLSSFEEYSTEEAEKLMPIPFCD